jgi:hypothetical protein
MSPCQRPALREECGALPVSTAGRRLSRCAASGLGVAGNGRPTVGQRRSAREHRSLMARGESEGFLMV